MPSKNNQLNDSILATIQINDQKSYILKTAIAYENDFYFCFQNDGLEEDQC